MTPSSTLDAPTSRFVDRMPYDRKQIAEVLPPEFAGLVVGTGCRRGAVAGS